jgi:hypothetical protein
MAVALTAAVANNSMADRITVLAECLLITIFTISTITGADPIWTRFDRILSGRTVLY